MRINLCSLRSFLWNYSLKFVDIYTSFSVNQVQNVEKTRNILFAPLGVVYTPPVFTKPAVLNKIIWNST